MHTSLRRILSLLLALTLIASPVSVLADGNTEDTEAVSAVEVLPEETDTAEETDLPAEEAEETDKTEPEETEAVPVLPELEETEPEQAEASGEETASCSKKGGELSAMATGEVIRFSNDYLEVALDIANGHYTIGTTGGNPDLSTDNNKYLLYSHGDPWSSITTVRVDGSNYIYGNSGFTSAPATSGLTNSSTAKYGDIEVKQVISIVPNASTLREDVVEIKYIVKNTGAAAASVGLRIMLDTMLGSHDDAPFRLPNVGNVTTEHEFSTEELPQYWQAFDSLENPTVVAYGNFVSCPILPDYVQFCSWERVDASSAIWNYRINPNYDNGDSAVTVTWDRTLAAGAVEVYSTRYGLSELQQDLRPPLGLTLASGSSVQLNTTQEAYLPYTITAYVQNLGSAEAKNAFARIELPGELTFEDPSETGLIPLGNLPVGQEVLVERTVLVKATSTAPRQTQYKVFVYADNADSKSLTKQLTIPAVIDSGKEAIIVVPGIAGSRLYADRAVGSFSSGHMMWEPETSGHLRGDLLDAAVSGAVSGALESAIETIWSGAAIGPAMLAGGFKGAAEETVVAAVKDIIAIQNEVHALECSENGIPVNLLRVDLPSAAKYGAQDTYKALVQSLQSQYGSRADVRLFSYDWRLDNAEAAEKLESYINENGYSKVTLVCHSMGGLVASKYLSRSVLNQNKVQNLITIGTPYLGAPKALYVLETGNFFDNVYDWVMSSSLESLSANAYGVYQLLPAKKYFTLNSTTYIQKIIDGRWIWSGSDKERLNYSESYALLSDRSFARKSSGAVKPMLSTANSFYDSLFSQNKHIIESTNTHVIVGYGKDTILEVKEKYNYKDQYKKCDGVTLANGGDGTVPMISATIGGLAPKDRTYFVNETHTGLVSNSDVIALVKNIIDGSSAVPNSITKTQPKAINSKNWIGWDKTERIQLKVECPVSLTIRNDDGSIWGFASDSFLYTEDDSRGSLYTFGKNNDTKMAYLSTMENNVELIGTDYGTMDYTVSLFDAGFEIEQIGFLNVPLSPSTIIFTNTDLDSGLRLELDENSDGIIDSVIEPSFIKEGTDLEAEYEMHVHSTDAPNFQWGEDNHSCIALFRCVDEDAEEILDCEVTSTVTTDEAANAAVITYTATVEFLDRVWSETRSVSIIDIAQDYLALEVQEQIPLTLNVSPLVDRNNVTWSAANITAGSAVVSVSEDGTVTALRTGSAMVKATVQIDDIIYTDHCRVDVVDHSVGEEVQIAGVTLPSTKATVNLFRSDFTKLAFVLNLRQNMAAMSEETPLRNDGAAIEHAEFLDSAVSALFSLRVADDRSLEIVPTDLALKDSASVRSSYKSPIRVVVDGAAFVSPSVTLTVKKTQPTIKAKTVKINSFDPQPVELSFTGGKVIGLEAENLPMDFHLNGTALSYTGFAQKAAVKLNMLAAVEGYALKRPVTVTVSISRTEPVVKLKPASLTLMAGTIDRAETAVSFSIPKFSDRNLVMMLSDSKGSPSNDLSYSYTDGKIQVSAKTMTPSDKTYKLSVFVDGANKKAVLTIKLGSNQPKLTVKASGAIDAAIANSPILLTPKIKGYHTGSGEYYHVEILRNGTEEVTDQFRIQQNGGTISVSAREQLAQGNTYTASLQTDLDNDGQYDCQTSVKLNVKWSNPAKVPASVTLKASGSIDVIRPGTSITLTPMFKNWYGHTLQPEDLQFYRSGTVIDPAPFHVTVKDGSYVITSNGAQSSAKYTVAFCAQQGGKTVSSKPVALKVKMGTVKVTLSTKEVTLLKNDRYDRGYFRLVVTDPTVSKIDRVGRLVSGSTEYNVVEIGNGEFAVEFSSRVPAKKAETIKLTIYFEGNTTPRKPNATVSLKAKVK